MTIVFALLLIFKTRQINAIQKQRVGECRSIAFKKSNRNEKQKSMGLSDIANQGFEYETVDSIKQETSLYETLSRDRQDHGYDSVQNI